VRTGSRFVAFWLVFSALALSQEAQTQSSDRAAQKHRRHRVSCLCGTVKVCSGDICVGPSPFGLDDDITVELRDKTGKRVIDSKKVAVELREGTGTTQDNKRVSFQTKEQAFCFTGKRDGNYQLAFILYKKGAAQTPVVFPTNYSATRRKPCDAIYMVEPPDDSK